MFVVVIRIEFADKNAKNRLNKRHKKSK